MIKSANFDTEKIRVINHWRQIIDKKSNILNKDFLVAAVIICEYCITDVYEQILPLFSFFKDESDQAYLNHLLSEHNTRHMIDELKDLSNGQYYFPEIYKELNGIELENILYYDVEINLNKKEIKDLVEEYIKLHDEFLKDYDKKYHRLKKELIN